MTSHAALTDLLRFWVGFEAELRTLAGFAVGIAVYGLFIYFFYEKLSKRNLLGERFQNPGIGVGKALMRGLRYLIVFPVVTFLFFMLLAFSFFFLSSGTPFETILLISMAVVTGVRIAAYISENTAHDIAKLLPLGLLGVFLVNVNVNVDHLREAWSNFQAFLDVETLGGVVLRYFIFLVLLESILRLIYLAVRPKAPSRSAPTGSPPGSDGPDPPRRGGGGGGRSPRPGRTPSDQRPPKRARSKKAPDPPAKPPAEELPAYRARDR